MINTLLPQYLAERAGLPDLIDVQKYRQHLQSMYPFVAGPRGPRLVGLAEGAEAYPLVGGQGLVYDAEYLFRGGSRCDAVCR